jgi:hypothetical protein
MGDEGALVQPQFITHGTIQEVGGGVAPSNTQFLFTETQNHYVFVRAFKISSAMKSMRFAFHQDGIMQFTKRSQLKGKRTGICIIHSVTYNSMVQRVFLEKLVKIFLAFYETRRFNAVFATDQQV